MQRYTILPNSEVIESLIGQYNSGDLTTIYGNAASGKTTSCLLASISVAKSEGKVIFIDTESGFNTERLKQLTEDKEILNNIFLLQPKSFREQHEDILKIKKLCSNEKIKLVIVDTIGKYYRVLLSENHKMANSMMVTQLRMLVRMARDLNKVVLLTNQVYSKMDSKDDLKMVGGNMMMHMSKVIIELHKLGSKRFASLTKYKTENENITHPNLEKKIEFEIKEKGLFIKR